jgi:hypothetical protein
MPATPIENFIFALHAKLEAHYADQKCPANVVVEAQPGKKYTRIVVRTWGSGSAFCFIDNATGDILKSDGWKRPAKGVRGNIRNGAADVGPYGPAYLR